eukprot:CAMPEP_0119395028 /NCGR_PEP_ID=MMETSP1334-20130426/131792_1 /TAXON_ID=127549 /ORGANISM="Calcidiscus leptoporus, Strain RCC1130" /LENGTH=45 /DNA_ID= /DNA_START= /DNA_END= /DNA_ORIENTATION=
MCMARASAPPKDAMLQGYAMMARASATHGTRGAAQEADDAVDKGG